MKNSIAKMIISIFMIFSIGGSAQANSYNKCESNLRPTTVMAVTSGGTTALGGLAGAGLCTGFLGAVFFDLGLSYLTCVSAVAATAGIAGTILAEDHNKQQQKKCHQP